MRVMHIMHFGTNQDQAKLPDSADSPATGKTQQQGSSEELGCVADIFNPNVALVHVHDLSVPLDLYQHTKTK